MFSQWKREKELIKWALDELNYITNIFFLKTIFSDQLCLVIRLERSREF
jgi:hypothetical protein